MTNTFDQIVPQRWTNYVNKKSLDLDRAVASLKASERIFGNVNHFFISDTELMLHNRGNLDESIPSDPVFRKIKIILTSQVQPYEVRVAIAEYVFGALRHRHMNEETYHYFLNTSERDIISRLFEMGKELLS